MRSFRLTGVGTFAVLMLAVDLRDLDGDDISTSSARSPTAPN
jgi:hypothetical protein